MRSNDYHFITRWRLHGAVEEVVEIVCDAVDWPRWWPAVHLDVRILEPGDPEHYNVGRLAALHARGFLPWALRWQVRLAEVDPLRRIVLEAQGDLDGRGVWSFEQDGEWVTVTHEWEVRTGKRLLRPFFVANYRWAMRMGEESLRRELARRRAPSPEEEADLPPPPQPPLASPVPLTLGMAGIWLGLGMAAAVLIRMVRSRRRRNEEAK